MLLTVIIRYGAIGIQFAVMAVLARSLSGDDYGRYMLVLGIVLSTYTLLGLGASETFVREAPKLLQRSRSLDVSGLAGGVLAAAFGSAALVAMIAVLLASILGFDTTETTQVLFIAGFAIGNGLIFNAAQLLLGGGSESLGSFFFYLAMNISLLLVTVPYALFAPAPSFSGIAITTTSAAAVTAVAGLLIVLLRIHPRRAKPEVIPHLVGIGVQLSVARALYYLGAWVPTILAGLLLAPVQAGYIGTACRMAIAVGAVTAAVRFAVRPAIVRAFDRGNTRAIKETCGRVATMAFAFACVAIAVCTVAGDQIVGLAFGSELKPAAPLLTILLIGTAFEALCGPVDEVLKMTGNQKLAIAILAIAVGLMAFMTFVLARHGIAAIAWVQVGYSVAAFGAMVLAVRWKLGIWLRPVLSKSSIDTDAGALTDIKGVGR